VDLAVITLIETDRMEKGDFIWTENYNLRLQPTGARKVTEEVNRWFNRTMQYQGKEYAWHYIMLLKAPGTGALSGRQEEETGFRVSGVCG